MRWDFQVSLGRLQEGASALMKCKCFRCCLHRILDQIRTNLVYRPLPRLLYRWPLEFLYKGGLRYLILIRRILVLLVALLMESFVAHYFVLLLVSDCEMFARLEQKVISGETGTGVDLMLDFVVWQWFEICRSHSSRLRRCVPLCRWRRLKRMECLGFDLEVCVYFCIRWRSSRKVALVWDVPFCRIGARISSWICLGETVMSRCECILHALWRNAKSV